MRADVVVVALKSAGYGKDWFYIMDIEKIIKELTLEEKAGLCSGSDFWHTKAVERLGVPSVMVSDGPHGLRKQSDKCDHMGVAQSVEAVCFPTASALACTFDRDLLYEVGQALSDECQAEEVSTLLGPGVNMKRSPLCGRNFEYFSEDPFLAGELGASLVDGVQSKGIGTSVKHFAANNQEYRRMSTSAVIEPRVLREIYLAAFETIVKKAQPTTIMCSYNRINGVYSCENHWLLNKVLREEWGFEGLVMTDWGAMNKRVPALKAGLDLEMPSSHGETDKQIVDAVKSGELSEEILDTAVRRVLKLVEHYTTHKTNDTTYDKEAHHNLSRKVAEEAAVLLKNNHILPLSKDCKVAFIGEFAEKPRIQGGGSSHINCYKISDALTAAAGYPVTYAKGYNTDTDTPDEALIAEAVDIAKNNDVAVIFAGLPDAFESEGYDRNHMDMPACQNRLIHEVAAVQPNTVVVLHNGSPITMPWFNEVSAVLEMYLAGQGCGEAAVNLLYGDACPSGKLAETFPLRVQDNPSWLNFPGERDTVRYSEGLFIGYRYYDAKEMDVLFPFGYGLSYTDFAYSNMRIHKITADDATLKKLCLHPSFSGPADGKVSTAPLSANENGMPCFKDTDYLMVSADITNTGSCTGKEIVQLYVSDKECYALRPKKELKGFVKVELAPGETKTVSFILDKRSFAYYNEILEDWYVESGEFAILIGASSRDIRLQDTICAESQRPYPFVAGDTTTCDDVYTFAKDVKPLDDLLAKSVFGKQPESSGKEVEENMGAGQEEMMKNMFKDTPLHSIISFDGGTLTIGDIQNTIDLLNRMGD